MLTIETRQLMAQHLYIENQNLSFFNGCSLAFNEKSSDIVGFTPEGKLWTCKNDAQAISKIYNWLTYWDDNQQKTSSQVMH